MLIQFSKFAECVLQDSISEMIPTVTNSLMAVSILMEFAPAAQLLSPSGKLTRAVTSRDASNTTVRVV